LPLVASLTVARSPAASVFDLLGRKENDLTYAVGWCLAVSPLFLSRFAAAVGVAFGPAGEVDVRLQTYDRDDQRVGITDIQLRSLRAHVIVEAKRGWSVPTRAQLRRYAPILRRSSAAERRFVVLTRWGSDARAVVAAQLGDEVEGFAIATLGVSDVLREARAARQAEREQRARLYLGELLTYLEGGGYVASHRDSRVYVVPLGKAVSEIGIPFHRIPYQEGIYWYGLSGGPKVPPNYVAFRFDGQLQSIHHVEESLVFERMSDIYPHTTMDWGPGVRLTLGPAISPEGVRSGKLRDRRVWADIDLLLTSATVDEAARLTRERDQRVEGARP
jgi:hypothetical protein